ncbi:MAG: hypothetical protein IPH84_02120 [Bacteroidales bacterium]|nr:hypothetical protein [Bacteroidales bacterium]
MNSYLLIYLHWVFLSPLFKRSSKTWKYDLNDSLTSIALNAGHKPLSISSHTPFTDLVIIIPGFKDTGISHRAFSSMNITDHQKPGCQCNFTWVTGQGFQLSASRKTHAIGIHDPLQSDPFILTFLDRLSGFNKSFDDDFFINLSIHRVEFQNNRKKK